MAPQEEDRGDRDRDRDRERNKDRDRDRGEVVRTTVARGGKPSASLYVRGVADETRYELMTMDNAGLETQLKCLVIFALIIFFAVRRSDELKELFTKYGPVKDVYIPLGELKISCGILVFFLACFD